MTTKFIMILKFVLEVLPTYYTLTLYTYTRNELFFVPHFPSFKYLNISNLHGKVQFPLMKKELHSEFLKGKPVNCWWFNFRAREMAKERYTNEVSTFTLSHISFRIAL